MSDEKQAPAPKLHIALVRLAGANAFALQALRRLIPTENVEAQADFETASQQLEEALAAIGDLVAGNTETNA